MDVASYHIGAAETEAFNSWLQRCAARKYPWLWVKTMYSRLSCFRASTVFSVRLIHPNLYVIISVSGPEWALNP